MKKNKKVNQSKVTQNIADCMNYIYFTIQKGNLSTADELIRHEIKEKQSEKRKINKSLKINRNDLDSDIIKQMFLDIKRITDEIEVIELSVKSNRDELKDFKANTAMIASDKFGVSIDKIKQIQGVYEHNDEYDYMHEYEREVELNLV